MQKKKANWYFKKNRKNFFNLNVHSGAIRQQILIQSIEQFRLNQNEDYLTQMPNN